MTMDTEIADMFAHCLPAVAEAMKQARDHSDPDPPTDQGAQKRPRQETTTKSAGKGWGRHGSHNRFHGGGARPAQGRPNRDNVNLEQLVTALCRMMLKQEREIQLLRTDKQFFLHMESGPQGMLGVFWQVAQTWQEGKNKTPPTITCSLRVTLIRCMMLEWEKRLLAMSQNEATVKDMAKHEMVKIDTEVMWNYQVWNPVSRKLEIDVNKPPIPNTQLLGAAKELRDLVHKEAENLIHHFHSTRKLTEKIQGDTLPFVLAVSMRGAAANRAFELLQLLEGSASLRVIGVRLRGERAQPSPMAQHLAKLLEQLEL